MTPLGTDPRPPDPPGPRWWGWVLLLLRLGMAAVFIAAAVPKIQAPDLFAISILNYQMLPPWGINTLALSLPWLELVVGVCLGLGLWRRACALVMAVLMVVFMIAYASARLRGLDIACGCFEVGEESAPTSAAWVILRDSALLIAALVLVRWDSGPRPLDRILRKRHGEKTK